MQWLLPEHPSTNTSDSLRSCPKKGPSNVKMKIIILTGAFLI